MTKCEHCGREFRLGIPMTAIKARLFDAIRRAGPAGIEFDDLWRLVFAERRASRLCMKTHIWQLNELIDPAGYRITRQGGTTYRMVGSEWKAMWKKPFDAPQYTKNNY